MVVQKPLSPSPIATAMTICWGLPMSIDHATSLQALQLNGMATAWRELQAEKPRQAHRPESWIERLICAEQTERQIKSLRYQIKAARFPIHRDLLGIDWTETPLSQAVVEQLAECRSLTGLILLEFFGFELAWGSNLSGSIKMAGAVDLEDHSRLRDQRTPPDASI